MIASNVGTALLGATNALVLRGIEIGSCTPRRFVALRV